MKKSSPPIGLDDVLPLLAGEESFGAAGGVCVGMIDRTVQPPLTADALTVKTVNPADLTTMTILTNVTTKLLLLL